MTAHEQPGSLRQAAARGVKWTSAASAVTTSLQLAQIAVLTHLLSPREWGLMAATMVVVGFATAFSDLGISNAIIVRRDIPRETLSSLYWANVLSGVAVAALVLAATPLVADFYRQPQLNGLLPWAALSFVVLPLGQQFRVLLEKDLRFDRLARVEVVSGVVGAAVAITSAALGVGALSLVLGLLANYTSGSLLLAALGWRQWRPSLRLRRSDLRGYMRFGLFQMGERSVGFLTGNVDYLLIGRFLGPSVLGTYALAYQLVMRPVLVFNPIVTRVAFPTFSRRAADNASLRRGFLELSRLVAFVALPGLVALALAAPYLVPVVFGARWHASIGLIQILAVMGALKALNNPVGSLMLAKNRPDVGFKVSLGMIVVLIVGLRLAVEGGITVTAWTYTGIVALVVAVWLRILWPVVGLRARAYLGAIAGPAAVAAATAAAMGLASLAVRGLDRPGLALAIVLACGLAASTVILLRFERPYLRELWGLLRTRSSARAGGDPAAAAPVPAER